MKNYLLLIAILLGVASGQSAELTAEQALSRFEQSKQSSVKYAPRHAGGMSSLTLNKTVGNLYVFSGGDGFVVLPADDAAPALLAYADSGEFDMAGNPGLAYWMEYYNREIEYMQSHGIKASQTTRSTTKQEIAPLIKTEWNQEAPYNALCPKVNGKETVTGCVATAMAQFMKYYNYPEHGKGTHSYDWSVGNEKLTFDYENTTFEWDKMTDKYGSNSSEESKAAVAKLMYACGVSVDMHYDVGDSGAATMTMGSSLIDIFNYSPALWMPNRNYYGIDEWEDMIYADLAKGMPVLYSGQGTAGGHQFICDGYSSDGFFHFNWGWGGMSNGYFLLTALNPADLGVGGGAGGFNSDQIATLGARLPQSGDKTVYIFYNSEGFTSDVTTVNAGEEFGGKGMFYNFSLATMPDGSRMGLKFTASDGTVKYADGPDVNGYKPYDGRANIPVQFPELADGTYTITPALEVNGEWSDIRMPVGEQSEITAVVNGGVATISNASAATVAVTDINVASTIYKSQKFPMPFKIQNTSSEEYYGNVTPVLFDSNGNAIAESEERPVDVQAGETQDISDYIAEFTAVENQDFTDGEYILVFCDDSGNSVSSPVVVTVQTLTAETQIVVTGLKLDEATPISDTDTVNFEFTVGCESGMFYGQLGLFIFPSSGGTDVYGKMTENIYLPAGESKTLTVSTNLADLKDGEYMAGVYNGDSQMTDMVYFRIDRATSGLNEIEGDNGIVKAYDLNGNVYLNPTAPGIYIINGKKVLITE